MLISGDSRRFNLFMSIVIRSSAQSDTELVRYRQQNVKRTEGIPDTVNGLFVVLEWKRIQHTPD